MSHPGDITTSGKVFTMAQSAELARMVFQRFGEDLESATRAWNRMLQNNCDSHQFRKLMEYRPRAEEIRDQVRRERAEQDEQAALYDDLFCGRKAP